MASSANPGDARNLSRRRLFAGAAAIGAAAAVTARLSAPAAAAPAVTEPSAAAAPASLFGNFLGTCQAGGAIADRPLVGGMSWTREDVYWSGVEPTKGAFDSAYLDSYQAMVAKVQSAGANVLPILDYTANWAVRRDAYSWEEGGRSYTIGPVVSETTNAFDRRVTIVDTATGATVTDAVQTIDKSKCPPADVADWEAYVEKVVSELTRAPYDVRYFEIWNEAHWDSGFWYGGLDDYLTTIHLPAAKIIQKYGAKVVYGGWVCGVNVNEWLDLLDRHDAWWSVDVMDMHYNPLPAMDHVLTESRHRRRDIAVWQDEIGYTNQTAFVPNMYAKAFHWALSNGLADDPDRFKLFWFAWHAYNDPNDPSYDMCVLSSDELSPIGRCLQTLGTLLGGTDVRTYGQFRTSPALSPQLDERASAAEAFQVGDDTIVLAVHLARQGPSNIYWDFSSGLTALHLNQFDHTVSVSFPGVATSATVSRVDIYGNSQRLDWAPGSDGRAATVLVPVRDAADDARTTNGNAEVRTFYVVVRR